MILIFDLLVELNHIWECSMYTYSVGLVCVLLYIFAYSCVALNQVAAGAGRKTLRMKQDGNAVVEEVASGAVAAKISSIDDKLDQQIGIRDLELSTTM